MNNEPQSDNIAEKVWRSYLTTGTLPDGMDLPWFETPRVKALARRIPSDPRCKICHYPFGGIGGTLVRSFLQLERSRMNPQLCNVCERFAESNPGGAELEVSVMFADIRGSTAMAGSMNAYEFSRFIDRFYQVTTNIVYEFGGLVEKLVGDEVTAFFVPAFSDNNNYAIAAVSAGKKILAAVGHNNSQKPWASIGIGIHTGPTFVGSIGAPGKNIDIAILGDTPNIAARLTSQAKGGEIVMSTSTVAKAGLDKNGLQNHKLTLKGKEEPFDVWVYKTGTGN